MVQAASFLFRESEETWNFRRVPRLMGVEDGSLRVPYIEGEIWGSSLPTEFKERMSSKMNFTQFPREPLISKSTPLHKGTIEYASRIPKQSALSPREEALMAMHLVRRNARSVLWVAEETLAPVGEQDSTNHDVGPRTSKSSSLSEGPNSKILRGYCGVKGSGNFGLSDTKPKAHVEE